MNLRKRIISVMLIVIIVLNNFPTVHAVGHDQIKELSVDYSMLDALAEVEYDPMRNTYQFDDSILGGINEGDVVHLVANARYQSTELGETKATLTYFRLEGEDSANYKLESPIYESIEKTIKIVPKVIKISPRKNYIYYGQTKPTETEEIANYADQVDSHERVNLKAKFKIEPGAEVRSDYGITLEEGSVQCDNNKYKAELDENVKFEVREYDPSVICTATSDTNEYVAVHEATLTAPEGYLISSGNQDNSEWNTTLDINMPGTETTQGSVTYYLRCNNEHDAEHYKAISKPKLYNYTLDMTRPKIESIVVEKSNDQTVLNVTDLGVFGKGNVKVTVKAVGTIESQDTNIYLEIGDVKKQQTDIQGYESNGKYYYTAEFELEMPQKGIMKAYAKNSSGEGEPSTMLTIKEGLFHSESVDNKQFILEDEAPTVTNSGFYNEHLAVGCDLIIKDAGSGIAKIEYGWDLDYHYCNYEKNMEKSHYMGFAQNWYRDTYVDYNLRSVQIQNDVAIRLELSYEDCVWANEDKHRLYVRVTDNAGNITKQEFVHEHGCDMMKPNLTNVTISEKENQSTRDAVLNFLSFGTFSNKSVKIVISADDNESTDATYKSGVAKVTINDREMEDKRNGTYELIVDADDELHDMKVVAEDNVGWKTEKNLKDITHPSQQIASNNLVVEDDPPTINFEPANPDYTDDTGKTWYGGVGTPNVMSIHVADDQGPVKSGIRSVTVMDNDVQILNEDRSSRNEQYYNHTFRVSDFLTDGEHKLEITAVDNAGNVYKKSTGTFYIDTNAPQLQNVEIRKPKEDGEENAVVDQSGINFFKFGTFSKDDIEIAVKAEDGGTKKSGIRKITINGEKLVKNPAGEYVLKVSPQMRMENMNVVVTDRVGHTKSEQLKEIQKGNKIIKSNDLIVENKEPKIETTQSPRDYLDGNSKIWYSQQNQTAEVKIHVVDDEGNVKSGLCSVKITDNDIVIAEENRVDYNDAAYDKSFEISELAEGVHKFVITATDYAGNTKKVEMDEFYVDATPPEIIDVKIREKENPSIINSAIHFLTFGTFAKKSVEIVIKSDDYETTDGIARAGVSMLTVNGDQMTKNSAGEYVYDVELNRKLSDMTITAMDNVGLSTSKRVTDINETDRTIQSDDLMVENNAPSIIIKPESSGYPDQEGKPWYGIDKKTESISISVTDDMSGLSLIEITDKSEKLGDTKLETQQFSSLELSYDTSYTMDKFEDGDHTLVVRAVDNAGNTFTQKLPTFNVDFTPPKEKDITTTDPVGKTIDGIRWFTKEDTITFRADSSDAGSGIKSMVINVNGKDYPFEHTDIKQDSEGDYVTVKIANTEMEKEDSDEKKKITEYLNPDNEQKYTVTCKVTDFANNSIECKPNTVHVDFENPTTEDYKIESTSINKILNILTFGIFSNDSLKLTVHASDLPYDSGVDYMDMTYGDKKNPIRMTDEGNGYFSTMIPVEKGESKPEDVVFEKEITITAHDKYAKESTTWPGINSTDGTQHTDSKYVLIENIVPVITLDLPARDGVDSKDGKTWYNSNKNLDLTVQDVNSGIRNIDMTINDIDVPKDKEDMPLLKVNATEAAGQKNTEENKYKFDLDYFESIVKEEPADGKYEIKIKVTDNAGNDKEHTVVYYIDKHAPTLDKVEFAPATSDGIKETSEFIEKLEYGYYFKKEFTATVCVSDQEPTSGLNKVEYQFDSYEDGKKKSETSGEQEIKNGKAKLTVPEGFKGQIFVQAFDNVGNRSHKKTTKAYVVDNAAPNISITNNGKTEFKDAAGNPLYVKENSISVEITDTVSGIREIGYSQSSEKNSFDRKSFQLKQEGYKKGDSLDDGWTVAAVDQNLVTKVTKTFKFDSDDNDIFLSFDATDNSHNKVKDVKNEKFTIDKTAPIINVAFRGDKNDTLYYNQNRVADVTVIDRNFDPNLIKVVIENTFGKVPSYTFKEKSNTEHVAVIDFDEGDYTFDVTGTDLGNHEATVNYSGGNEKEFFVDKTSPELQENFDSFKNPSTKNSFKVDKDVNIQIKEHNFDPELVSIRVLKREPGYAHSKDAFEDATEDVVGAPMWKDNEDIHTISFTVREDAVYQIELSSTDMAENQSDSRSTVVFEIDKTVPVVKAKNGSTVSSSDTKFLDVYDYQRQDDPIPSVEFEDVNFDHIKYSLTICKPDHSNPEAVTVIKPVQDYLKGDDKKSGVVRSSKVSLPEFKEDGVYELQLIAVDVAGNESVLNVNTYARMINQDVLAYVLDSNLQRKSGVYSFEYENGNAISKRPDDFEDINIYALAKQDTVMDVVLRDTDGNILNTNAEATKDESIYGMKVYNYTLRGTFFRDNFQDDIDTEMLLSVKNADNRIDLGKIHIDNIEPTCVIPKELKSWHWYYGDESRTITITNISELVDKDQCKVYDNGKEVAFDYSSDDDTLAFTLQKGWHSVGVVLDDMAGNTFNVQEKNNIHIGFFWLYMIGALSVTVIGVTIFVVIRIRKRRILQREE